MSYIIDTSVLIEIERGNQQVIAQVSLLPFSPSTDLCLTVFNFCELYSGLLHKEERSREKALERLQEYRLLHTTKESAIIFSRLIHETRKKGITISHFDGFIAAIALEKGFTLITTDRDFQRIPSLKVHLIPLA